MSVTEWELRRVNGDILEAALVDVRVKDAFNRYAREATAWVDDDDGTKAALYPELTPVVFRCKTDDDAGFLTRFGGFVIRPVQEDNRLTLECLSHDAWLRRRQVFADYAATLVSEILEDLVTGLTPLNWDPVKVTVSNDVAVTRTWRGESLDVVLRELASLSAGEEFGADDDADFFFRPPATTAAPYGFPDGAYEDTDFDIDASREINRVTLYYGTGMDTGAVTVNDMARQAELQTLLGSPRPVVSEFTTTYPEITTEAAAEAKARDLLEQNATLQKGIVRTWDALQHKPGQLVPIEDSEKAVDAEFRIASIEYFWREDRTVVAVAENRLGVVDVLVAMSGEITRIDNRDADVGAEIVQFVDLEAEVLADTHLQVVTRSIPTDIFLFGQPPDFGPGLVGRWRMRERSGNLMDTSGKGNHLVPAGGLVLTGYGAIFDGVDDVATAPDDASLDVTTAFTFRAFILATALNHANGGNNARIAHKASSWDIRVNNVGSLGVRLFRGGVTDLTSFTANGAIVVDTGYRLWVVFDSATITYVLNGVVVATTPSVGAIDASSGVFDVGGAPAVGLRYWQGYIRDPDLYNRALPLAELLALDAEWAKKRAIGPPVAGGGLLGDRLGQEQVVYGFD